MYMGDTAISINVVGSKQKAIRQDRKVIWEFFIINSSKSAMPRPFSEDLRWRAIWMKEMLGYQVDEVAAALRMPPRTIERYVLKVLNFGEVKANTIADKQCGHAPARGIFDYESSAFKSTPKRHYVT